MSPIRMRRAGLLAAPVLAAFVLTACSADVAGDPPAGGEQEGVASLEKPSSSSEPSAPGTAPKKYKFGSKGAVAAEKKRDEQLNQCVTQAAQKAGIPVKINTGSKDTGKIIPQQYVSYFEGRDSIQYPNEFSRKWYEEIENPCGRKFPRVAYEEESDSRTLETALKQYECLKGQGLQDIKEPTENNTALFTSEGMSRYFGDGPDPAAKRKLEACGITFG